MNIENWQKIAIAALALAFAGGCAGGGPPPVYHPAADGFHEGRKIYFSMKDAKGDDKGPGTYQYPLEFNNREGFFDIENFQVEDGGSNVIFRITTRRPIDKFRPDGSSEAKGWFLQLMDIYIDKDHKPNSGVRKALPGRFVQFPEDGGWEKMVLVSPWPTVDTKRLIEGRTNDLELVHLKPKIVIADIVFVEGFDFVVQVPKGMIGGEPQPNWGYQCFMMQFEPKNLANFQFQNEKVLKFPTDTAFGGGADQLGNPSVLDCLAPTEEDQKRWLSSYITSPNPEEIEPATVPMMYADAQGKPPISFARAKTRATTALGAPPAAKPRPTQQATATAAAPARKAAPPARPVAIVRKVRPPEDAIEPETQPAKRYKPVSLTPAAPRYQRETFSGDADDLFLNVPRSR